MYKHLREKRNRRAQFAFPPSLIERVDKYITGLKLPPGERAPSRTDVIIRSVNRYMEEKDGIW